MAGQGLLCIGLTTLDIVALPIDALPEDESTKLIQQIVTIPAGTAGGAAMVAAKLGVETYLSSAIGGDLAGRFVRMALEEYGVNTSLLEVMPAAPTSATVLAIDSNGRRPNFHALGAGVFGGVSDETKAKAANVRFFHYGGIGGPRLDNGAGAELAQIAREAGAIVTCDLISPQPSAVDELRRILPHVNYFLPSNAEALMLSGASNLADAARFFVGLGAGACIIKDGGRGSFALIGGEEVQLPAYDIKPVDTTSCGDSFCAGFIAALDRGFEPVDALRFATAVAAHVAQGPGTLGTLSDFDGVQAAMQSMKLREFA